GRQGRSKPDDDRRRGAGGGRELSRPRPSDYRRLGSPRGRRAHQRRVPRRRAVIKVTTYSRPACPLCDAMKALVPKVSRTIPCTLEDIDIYGDDELEEKYGLEIPVLFVEGKRVAQARIKEDALIRILTSASPQT